jgi:hypothetical protein
MCGGGGKPPPPPTAKAKPAAIASVEDTAPTLDIDQNKSQAKKKKGTKAFKQTTNISPINTPIAGSGLAIPK